MTLEEFIAEIETTFKNIADSGDLPKVSIKGWVISCLKEMGKNICEKNEGFVEIKGSQGKLPEHFKSLIVALKLNNEGYQIHGDIEKAKDSFIYRQRIEQPAYYDFITNEYITNGESKIITEKVIMNDQEASFYYSPEMLSVVKGFKKDSFDVDCININPRYRDALPHQISINNSTMQTNFKEGRVYIQYNSLPTDEDGEVVIPEYTTGDLIKYIENYVKIKLAEYLTINTKNPQGISQFVSIWMQQNIPLRNAAKSECNWNGLPKDWHKTYKRKLQIEISQFNLPRY